MAKRKKDQPLLDVLRHPLRGYLESKEAETALGMGGGPGDGA
jgi:hypothetical protein